MAFLQEVSSLSLTTFVCFGKMALFRFFFQLIEQIEVEILNKNN